MITFRPANERGHANHGWLDANFTFSFGDYYDPKWMGFRALRVINDDIVAPARGFGMHPHDNMEILTYMIDGSFAHRDSTGATGAITPGELQHMSAGTGIYHSEHNASDQTQSHSLQIWLQPNKRNVTPQYQQRRFRVNEEPNKLHLLASSDGHDDSFQMHADADLSAALVESGHTITHKLTRPHAFLQVVQGEVTFNGTALKGGDGVAISDEKEIALSSSSAGEVLLFDLD
jgi:redox-sensitive bicupin YhaK (pirin superfamily)